MALRVATRDWSKILAKMCRKLGSSSEPPLTAKLIVKANPLENKAEGHLKTG
jgi:hypothetical protein